MRDAHRAAAVKGAGNDSFPCLDSLSALEPARLFSLEDRSAVVTGAAGGIGSWLAAGLAAAGAHVLLTDVDEHGLERVRGALADCDLPAASFAADLRDRAAYQGIVRASLERFGRLDVLVNCAAINRRMPMLEVDPETYDLVTEVDLRAPYFLSQAAARAMRETGGGSIVAVTSVNASFGLEGNSLYGPAKAGLTQLTQVLAQEWSRYGIRANCIAPGFFDTPLAAPIWSDPDTSRWLLNRVPLGRPGKVQELVGALLLLASDAGSFITGQTIVVDGGFLSGGRWFTPDR